MYICTDIKAASCMYAITLSEFLYTVPGCGLTFLHVYAYIVYIQFKYTDTYKMYVQRFPVIG